jgi:hypothetical protein
MGMVGASWQSSVGEQSQGLMFQRGERHNGAGRHKTHSHPFPLRCTSLSLPSRVLGRNHPLQSAAHHHLRQALYDQPQLIRQKLAGLN